MVFSREFKQALSALPSAEKDKLLFRLLKKDLELANRLEFELLSEESTEQKRDALQKILQREIEKATDLFYSPGYLTMDVRSMSGRISQHVYITKDKFGEAWLNLFLTTQILRENRQNLKLFSGRKAEKFYIPVVARIFKILTLIRKLDEDYLIEFQKPLAELQEEMSENGGLMKTATRHGLDINWLNADRIPEDIEKIQKEIRSMGFLR